MFRVGNSSELNITTKRNIENIGLAKKKKKKKMCIEKSCIYKRTLIRIYFSLSIRNKYKKFLLAKEKKSP